MKMENAQIKSDGPLCDHCEDVAARLLKLIHHMDGNTGSSCEHCEYVTAELSSIRSRLMNSVARIEESYETSTNPEPDNTGDHEIKLEGGEDVQIDAENLESEDVQIDAENEFCASDFLTTEITESGGVAVDGEEDPSLLQDQAVEMSGRTEIVYDPDGNIDIDELKLEHPEEIGEFISYSDDRDRKHQCSDCGLGYRWKRDLYRHKQIKHSDKKYPCDQCEFVAHKSSQLAQHKSFVHEGTGFQCDKCDYFTATPLNLKRHTASKHDVVRYPCDQCDFSATQKGGLAKHKASKHEGIRYPCDMCEYAATDTSNLRKHKASQHEGKKIPCDQCDYVATQFHALKRHKLTKH